MNDFTMPFFLYRRALHDYTIVSHGRHSRRMGGVFVNDRGDKLNTRAIRGRDAEHEPLLESDFGGTFRYGGHGGADSLLHRNKLESLRSHRHAGCGGVRYRTVGARHFELELERCDGYNACVHARDAIAEEEDG